MSMSSSAAHKAAYTKRRTLAIYRGTWESPVPADVVRDHIAVVRAETGMTFWQFATVAGVHVNYLEYMARAGPKVVTAAVARRVLAVTADTVVPAGRRIPAMGTARRLQALAVMGWSGPRVAEATGMSEDTMRRIRRNEYPYVFRSTAERVDAAYRNMWNAPPPDDTPVRRAVIDRTRQAALAAGWAPPAAWDNIDDPEEKPQGIRRAA